MISFLFDLVSACGHFMWSTLTVLVDLAFSLLGAVLSVLTWPGKACLSLLDCTLRWTPVFVGFCLLLGVLLLGCTLLALLCRARRHR